MVILVDSERSYYIKFHLNLNTSSPFRPRKLYLGYKSNKPSDIPFWNLKNYKGVTCWNKGSRITQRLLSILIEYCPSLTSVDLSNYTQMTDAWLRVLSENCHGLTYVNLSCCTRITDTGITALAQSCHGLTYLDLSGCKGIKYCNIKELKKPYPWIGLTGRSHLNFLD